MIAFTGRDSFSPFELKKYFILLLSWLDSDFIRKSKLDTKLKCSLNAFLNYAGYSGAKSSYTNKVSFNHFQSPLTPECIMGFFFFPSNYSQRKKKKIGLGPSLNKFGWRKGVMIEQKTGGSNILPRNILNRNSAKIVNSVISVEGSIHEK